MILLSKKGQDASAIGHLGGWIIAMIVLALIFGIMFFAFGKIDLNHLRNLRLG